MAPPATTNPAPAERRRFSIRLPRPLWIGLAAAFLAVFGAGARIGVPIWMKHAALREIERAGGWFEMEPAGPEWLRDWLDDEQMEVFDEVFCVELTNSQATDATLSRLRCLTGLQWLSLSNTPVTDAGLAHLKGLTRLKELHLENTAVTDAGVFELQRALPQLKIFWGQNR